MVQTVDREAVPLPVFGVGMLSVNSIVVSVMGLVGDSAILRLTPRRTRGRKDEPENLRTRGWDIALRMCLDLPHLDDVLEPQNSWFPLEHCYWQYIIESTNILINFIISH